MSIDRTFSLHGHHPLTLLQQGEQLLHLSKKMYMELEEVTLQSQIQSVIEEHYLLGRVSLIKEIAGGYINRSFRVNCIHPEGAESSYFLRKYQKRITEQEILFEHALIKHSISRGFPYSAPVIKTKEEQTFVKVIHPTGGIDYYALYIYLPGKDQYSWDNPSLNDEEMASAANILALFHLSGQDFIAQGVKRVEPQIMDFLASRAEYFTHVVYSLPDEGAYRQSKFHRCVLKKLTAILEVIQSSLLPPEIWTQMPQIPCHNDFHPGNLKFTNNRVVGVFDFDWSKIDLRLFDVALAIVYCCSSWEDPYNGQLLLDKCKIFLHTYQQTLDLYHQDHPHLSPSLPSFTSLEKEHFPSLLAAANLYLINWSISTFYNDNNLNDYEYYAYLQHSVNLMEWIESNRSLLKNIIRAV
ncbi:MAG: phosphotransferase [Oligoflexia bacterium]|nr:phosphotransferase [Oligoflexia bacterium]MBF0367390.1 phosphotransferase [Oligoflexia bacterium]